jgi:heme exporter protein A
MSRVDDAPLRTAGVTVQGLAIDRGGWRLFENISFSARPGEHVALTGPNGAGKTSLLRAIAGFLRPSSGTINIADAGDAETQIHFLGHRDGLKATLDVRAHVRFWADLLGGSGAADAILERVGLTRVADLPARTLSAGQSRRLALARLLVAPRPVWLLDEPAAALDTNGKAFLDGLIRDHRASGGIVIAAVHETLGTPSQTVTLG